MTPFPRRVGPVRPRLPDWVFALGMAGSILVLIIALAWIPDSDQFTEPLATIETDTASVGFDNYSALADVRPEEEPPPVETIAVEEFGFEIESDGGGVSWGTSIRNAHSDYAADFELRLTIDGTDLLQSEEYTPSTSALVLPGSRIAAGGKVNVIESLPADTTVEIEVIGLEWFAFNGATEPEPQEPPLSSRVDAAEVPDDGGPRLSVTFTNTAAYALDFPMTAIFHRSDGTPVGGERLLDLLPLPPGESTRDIRLWNEDFPAGADLSLTEFVPSW